LPGVTSLEGATSLRSAATAAPPTAFAAAGRNYWRSTTPRRSRMSPNSWDFYTISTCRDLLFHVQERQFAIPEIKAFLVRNGLTFIGFMIDPAVQHHYRVRFAHDAAMTDLDCWSALEAESPLIFTNMYQFWVQKS
jgi:hypothetical protein